MLIFTLFSQGSSGAMTSITGNAAMLNKVYIPKYMYSLSRVLSSLVTFGFSIIILVLIMIATGAPFSIYILYSFLPVLLVVLFTIRAGLLLATLNVFFRDIQHLYKVFTTLANVWKCTLLSCNNCSTTISNFFQIKSYICYHNFI